jgi:hypothetical protein
VDSGVTRTRGVPGSALKAAGTDGFYGFGNIPVRTHTPIYWMDRITKGLLCDAHCARTFEKETRDNCPAMVAVIVGVCVIDQLWDRS